jgi:hypothetical protein
MYDKSSFRQYHFKEIDLTIDQDGTAVPYGGGGIKKKDAAV